MQDSPSLKYRLVYRPKSGLAQQELPVGCSQTPKVFPNCSQSENETSAAAYQHLRVKQSQLFYRPTPGINATERTPMLFFTHTLALKQSDQGQNLDRAITMQRNQYLTRSKLYEINDRELVVEDSMVENPSRTLNIVTRTQMFEKMFCKNQLHSNKEPLQIHPRPLEILTNRLCREQIILLEETLEVISLWREVVNRWV